MRELAKEWQARELLGAILSVVSPETYDGGAPWNCLIGQVSKALTGGDAYGYKDGTRSNPRAIVTNRWPLLYDEIEQIFWGTTDSVYDVAIRTAKGILGVRKEIAWNGP